MANGADAGFGGLTEPFDVLTLNAALDELKAQQKELGQHIKVMEPELEVIKTKREYILGWWS